uniref:Uncharacterized protein n=1 Tax=Coccolithus braarudii TaxID=221442 RepID=A0A7S0Q977_9EUKA|mmetsp:Transcript_48656/g.103805  ORF Transcript_48656/g.103805 Transcript_48656/m.103805 type:complete len:205 (+) Transcript_48656:46-660(+)|eukprot:CAMPEP_0183341390 /NCGR_PEP_ID=MMETSP0164_2-20130417/7650_1 /TAXON_ID=221442 /ORGANISM="Coccolithus pelagicus ssp braarudi, Strain PLY182g" /LENGTH=204 /DNA_ID=CAMNT_0025511693 /DNA_START=44 /DNA_END=658 /DNA_ORIENTATION=-
MRLTLLCVVVLAVVAVASASGALRSNTEFEAPVFIEQDPAAADPAAADPATNPAAASNAGPGAPKEGAAGAKDTKLDTDGPAAGAEKGRLVPPDGKGAQVPVAWPYNSYEPAYRSTFFLHPWQHPAFGPRPNHMPYGAPSNQYTFSYGPYPFSPYGAAMPHPYGAAPSAFPYLSSYPQAAAYHPASYMGYHPFYYHPGAGAPLV